LYHQREYIVNNHLPHRPQIFTGIKCACGIFFASKKNKHLTPAIFGGVPLSWRATRKANGHFRSTPISIVPPKTDLLHCADRTAFHGSQSEKQMERRTASTAGV
jgi:hypothetical protein